jgi:hypothetical protein
MPTDEAVKPPAIPDVAKTVAGVMVAYEPVMPLHWAIARDTAGKPLYAVAIVMGSQNVPIVVEQLEQLMSKMKQVDLFPPDQVNKPNN